MAGAGATVLFTTHFLREAEQFADRVVVISAGRLVADGTPGELMASAGSGRTVEVTTQDPDALRALALPGVTEVIVHGSTVRLRAADADGTVRRLYDSGVDFHGLSVTGGDLDDALLALTAADEEHRNEEE
jgi:ABC-2 type transport system ATP-binding protein